MNSLRIRDQSHGRLDGRDALKWPGHGIKDVQDRAVAMAKKNAEAAFVLGEKIAKAQNFQDILTLQTRFAQDQMQVYAAETQELHKLIGDAVQKLPRG